MTPKTLRPEEWRNQAACNGVPTRLFFAEKGSGVAEAKIICKACPVRTDCLETALRNRERIGVWGGLTPKERRRVLKMRAIRNQEV